MGEIATSDAATDRVLVDYSESGTYFFSVTPPEGKGTVSVSPSGGISVKHGTSRIEFIRSAGSPWHFRGFRYEPISDLTHGPIRSVEITPDSLLIEDVNDNASGTSKSYKYEILIRLADGTQLWIDPVIENKSGGGPDGL